MSNLRQLAGALLAGALLGPLLAAAAPLVPVNPPSKMPAGGWAPLDPATQPKFVYDLPVPIFYTPAPDATNPYPGYDYYEIEAAPVEQIPVAFPQPPGGAQSPAGYQWLGLYSNPDPITGARVPVYTHLWGYAQVNGGLISQVMGHPVATYPSMSFRATKGRPVKVKWINNTTNWNITCPYPDDATQPCGIDRTLMGVRGPYDPATYGGLQQPDNAMVVHLHGGEIPPDSDGFAELWFGNTTTSAAFPAFASSAVDGSTFGATQTISPAFLTGGVSNGVTLGALERPVGNSMIYNYPMVQEAATIWYHDHALGKTRVNVIAGPAGYFHIEDPAREATLGLPSTGDCTNAGILTSKCFDIPIVVQDRAFNENGTINFPNGLGQANANGDPLVAGAPDSTGFFAHPQWVPEYFGDMAVVNGAIWPRFKVEPRAYRFRFLDGSNARCYTFGLKIPGVAIGPSFHAIGSDQGYLPAAAKTSRFTMCPGERFDVVIDFSAFRGKSVYLTNTAGAPFPNGPTPQDPVAAGGFPFLANIMRFDVVQPVTAAYPTSWSAAGFDGGPIAATRLPTDASIPVRELVLNEHLDDLGNPLAVQIDGKAFEDAVTETPNRGAVEVWKIINTTVDAHPMHLHLVQLQIVSRQPFNVLGYRDAIATATGIDKTLSSVTPFLYGTPRAPDAYEAGWKDTAKSFPGEVLTVVARWDGGWADCPNGTPQNPGDTRCIPAPLAGTGPGADFFQPVTGGPYVWHCHIVDHEDNEMMRPSLVLPVKL